MSLPLDMMSKAEHVFKINHIILSNISPLLSVEKIASCRESNLLFIISVLATINFVILKKLSSYWRDLKKKKESSV